MAFLRGIKESSPAGMYVGGLMGCKGDAYTGEGALPAEQAREFHSWQAGLFKASKADFLYAGIMPALPEALGMAMALADSGLPYIISFTLQRNGTLIDGHTLEYAIRFIDDHVSVPPLCYMTNCVHPRIAAEALSQPFNRTEAVRTRFLGIQANTSALPYDELDGAAELQTSSPVDWAEAVAALQTEYHLRIFGGCCGTDHRHLDEMARRLKSCL